MAASATLALKAGVWFRRGRLLIVSPDSLGTACPLSGRNSTYRPVQISAAGSEDRAENQPRPRQEANMDDVTKCPFTGTRTRTNRDWWPNQLNLQVLHRNSS